MIRTVELKLRDRKYEALTRTLWLCRMLYNAALQERREAYAKQKKSLSFFDQCKELTQLRADAPEYAGLDVTMTRLTVLRRLDLAFKAFFRRCKAGQKPGFPRFKGRDRFSTLVFGPAGWSLRGRRLRLNGIGTFSATSTPHREGVPEGLRLVLRAGRWYAQMILDVGPTPMVRQGKNGVGIDVGLRTFATMSDGETIENPRFLRESLTALAGAGRNLSSKTKGSNRRQRAKAVLVRLHDRIRNRRRNFIFQAVAALARRYDGFAVEDLDIQEMQSSEKTESTRGLRRGIMDAAWGMFMRALACKAEEAGMPFVRVNPKGTSQRCSCCGSVVRKTLRDRIHDCHACGLVLDRDLNAARNIHDLGWRSAAKAAEDLG